MSPVDGLSSRDACALLDRVKLAHPIKVGFTKIGTIKPMTLKNARTSFAHSMTDEEVPLALLDSSFLQNGRAGLLLTNRRLYSSALRQPLKVRLIRNPMVKKASVWKMLLVSGPLAPLFGPLLYPRILVDGVPVHKGPMSAKDCEFWTELLKQVGKVAGAL
jgi:hypothetical protein